MTAQIVFERIHAEIPGAVAAAVGSVHEAAFAARAWGTVDVNGLGRTLREWVRAWSEVYVGIGGAVEFGSNDEIVASASRGTLYVRVHHGTGRFVGVLLGPSGNPGYLRFRMREYLRLALQG